MDGSYRPLAIASIIWRSGAETIVGQLRSWSEAWAGHMVFGGIPEHGVLDCHVKIKHGPAKRGAHSPFVKQDRHRFFDTVRLPSLQKILVAMGAPLGRLVDAFYHACGRRFWAGKAVSPWTHSAKKGLLQGCPLSPVLTACVMHCWAARVPAGQLEVDTPTYCDDRLLWRTNPDKSCLVTAKLRSDQFDAARGFSCRPRKRAIAAASASLAVEAGVDGSSTLHILGAAYDMLNQSGVALPDLDIWRLRYLIRATSFVSRDWRMRKNLLKTLAVSVFSWAGGTASLSDLQLDLLLSEVKAALTRALPAATVPVDIFELVGWDVEPGFATSWAHLSAAVSYRAKRPRWHDDAPLDLALASWTVVLPRALSAVRSLGWFISPDRGALCRHDGAGQLRTFRMVFDNPMILKEWLLERWRADALLRCGRVERGLHRSADGPHLLAQGLELPRPPPGGPLFQGHRQAIAQAGADKNFGWRLRLRD